MSEKDCKICQLMRERIPQLSDKEIHDYHVADRTLESFPRDIQAIIVEIMIEAEGE